jgi:hypothetical protein
MITGRTAVLQAGFLLVAILAHATSQKNMLRIKVLDSETRSVSLQGGDVPKNCDQVNFDAYCNNSKTATVTNTLLVQEDSGSPFHIACTIDSKYSRCAPLPKGETFDARREKHGFVVYYVDDKGKVRGQLYTLVDAEGKAGPPGAATAVATQPALAAAAHQQSAPETTPAPPVLSVGAAPQENAEKVRCDFSSTPAGADITLDGKFVGSTPSVIELVTGTHVVSFSLPGFTPWQRELTVLPGSDLRVSGILQKQQP